MEIFMNTRVSVLTDKQAFSAGEQFVSPVMEKKKQTPKPKQSIKTALCFDVEIANARETKTVKSQIIYTTEAIGILHQCSPV